MEAALPMIAWARIWSPVAPLDWRDEAWRLLAFPRQWTDCESDFTSAFLVGLPAPDVPLLLHAALGLDGGVVREDWVRVIAHLELRWSNLSLPPDHLGVACEVLACAIERDEGVLIRELVKRYLDPWCAVARERLTGHADGIQQLPERFARDLAIASGAN